MPEQLNRESSFDVLADIFDTLRFRGSIFFKSNLAAPWGISLEAVNAPRFHMVLSGTCFVGTKDSDPVQVSGGEIAMLTGGDAHWIADKPGRTLVPSSSAIEACELNAPFFQEGKISNQIICGIVHFDQQSLHPVLTSLPQVLHFAQLKTKGAVWATVSIIEAEIARTGINSGRIIDRLTEALFLQLLEQYADENSKHAGFLGALRDRRISQALELIHEFPGHDWTLTSLGNRVGMSRASLTRNFKSSVGVAPITYLANWRMDKAYNALKYSMKSAEEIADMFGFSTVGTMNKALRRHHNCTVAMLRRKK